MVGMARSVEYSEATGKWKLCGVDSELFSPSEGSSGWKFYEREPDSGDRSWEEYREWVTSDRDLDQLRCLE